MKKGLFDIEDFAWFFGFIFLLVVIVIILSVPGCKDKIQKRLEKGGNELEVSVASRELSGFLNAKVPSYNELETRINADIASKILSDTTGAKAALAYLKPREQYYKGKTLAEFIGFMYANKDDKDLMWKEAPWRVFDTVVFSMFRTSDWCKYPGSSWCPEGKYTYPLLTVIYVKPVDDMTKILDPNWDSRYDLISKSNNPLGGATLAVVSQLIPLPDGGVAVVKYTSIQPEESGTPSTPEMVPD